MISVSDAVASRKSTRAFLNKKVPAELIRDILAQASRAPSGGNLQPWFVDVVSDEALRDLKACIKGAMARCPDGEGTEYPIYPAALSAPYKTRQRQVAADMYALLGISREDKLGRVMQMARNYEFFDAPVGLFFSIDRQMAQNQWAHLGMFIQTIALLAVERGMATCMQEAWAVFHKTVGRYFEMPEERMLFCGMALGFADQEAAVNRLETSRMPIEAFVKFHS